MTERSNLHRTGSDRGRWIWLGTFGACAAALLAWAGDSTWGREHVGLLTEPLALHYGASTPLPAPFYTWNNVAFALLGALCLVACLRLLVTVGRGAQLGVGMLRAGRRPALGESGQAMTEVAVSFPVLLATTLILMQMALLFQAKNVVTYASFAATRAAVVWIPAETDNEGRHSINTDGGDKYDKIHQAAAMACVPISPRASVVLGGLPGIGAIAGTISSAMGSMLSGLGVAGEVLDNGIQRYAYSHFATALTFYKGNATGLQEVSGNVSWSWPTDSDVAVQVTHRYRLQIPLVNRWIGSAWSLIDLGPIFSFDLPGRFIALQNTTVLPLEGRTGNPPITGYYDWL